ncbi:MAG: heat-inducible transcriptional repressor HrcA [Actinobacteria bacterium]|jgi:heat-inducible transcriptional repressor|nr:heat-inducible transcriptional repressor HrcA [Actinomycetota bacterium]
MDGDVLSGDLCVATTETAVAPETVRDEEDYSARQPSSSPADIATEERTFPKRSTATATTRTTVRTTRKKVTRDRKDASEEVNGHSKLGPRTAAILTAVVSEYIETAQPVGSHHISVISDIGVSPATVRSEMAQLEQLGYLMQPHVSAGRVPTDKGYRFFVDQLAPRLDVTRLDMNLLRKVQAFFAASHGEMEQILHDTSRLLSALTDYAAVVVAPPSEAATIRSVQLVGLNPRSGLLVLVLSNGVVEKRAIEFPAEFSDELLGMASAHLMNNLKSSTLHGSYSIPATGHPGVDTLVQICTDELAQLSSLDKADYVFVDGASRVAEAFDAVETVRSVLSMLEEHYAMVALLNQLMKRGLTVAIGKEHGVEPLSECAVVVAPYEVGDPQSVYRGTIGVLGPTRMHYQEALAAVTLVGQRLSKRLTDMSGA